MKSKTEEKDPNFVPVPNGFNEYLLISSAAHLKHSINQTATISVPSCSCVTVSLHSDQCKMSVSSAGTLNRQKMIPPISQNISGETGKTGVHNRHISENAPQNAHPSIVPYTVPSKLPYTSSALHPSEPPVNKPLLPSTSPPTLVSQTSHMINSSKYSSANTSSHLNANGTQSLGKLNSIENGHQLQVAVSPGQVCMFLFHLNVNCLFLFLKIRYLLALCINKYLKINTINVVLR